MTKQFIAYSVLYLIGIVACEYLLTSFITWSWTWQAATWDYPIFGRLCVVIAFIVTVVLATMASAWTMDAEEQKRKQ